MNKKIPVTIYFDTVIALSILAIILWGSIKFFMIPILAPVLLISVGLLMVFSKKYKDIILIERIIYWICHNTFKPKTQINHFIWGIFSMFMGIASFFFYDDKNTKSFDLLDQISRDKSFWVLLIIILALNLFTGLYTSKIRKEKRSREDRNIVE